jgi:hypothetical protein
MDNLLQVFPPTSSNLSSPLITFSSLPLELRTKIWDATFSPRLLSIYTHYGQIHCAASSAMDPSFQSQITKGACVVFTAAEGMDDPYQGKDFQCPRGQRSFEGYLTITPYMKVPPPRGPVALEVCRESRGIALKRYELAFAGINLLPGDVPFEKEWTKRRFGERRIWVDFKHDVLHIWNADLQIQNAANPPLRAHILGLFGYLPEEFAKIRRLAIKGVWDRPMQPVGGNGPYTMVPPAVPALLRSSVKRGVALFGGLEELLVLPQLAGTSEAVREAEAERVKGEIIDILRAEVESASWRESRPPEVTMITDLMVNNRILA